MPAHLFHGVLRMDYHTAQEADVSRQHYSVCPRYWYVDAVFVCHGCGGEFLFTVNEQRFWYEDRRFYVDSSPRHCNECRKADRVRVELKRRYDYLISEALGQCPLEMKQEIVGVINALEAAEGEIPEKMSENRTRLYAQLAKTVY